MMRILSFVKNSESMVGFEISKVFSIRGWGYVGRNIFDVSDTTSRNIHVEDISEKLNEEEFDIFYWLNQSII